MGYMTSKDIINYKEFGFDNSKYLHLQKGAILERLRRFYDERLYLEIGGKFLDDPHAARVLPGFNKNVKTDIFRELRDISEILFCVMAQDIVDDRKLLSTQESYSQVVERMLREFEEKLSLRPQIVINLIDGSEGRVLNEFMDYFENLDYKIYRRYFIKGYPDDTSAVLSERGYGADDYALVTKKLVLVTGAASNSGKMSTALGQLFHETNRGMKSGYAKYETFPIWNLPLEHPVNLAYEAATADIGDVNMYDELHEQTYGVKSVNYNRDIDAFVLLQKLSEAFLKEDNPIREYKSPTDMGISNAGEAITNDQICAISAYQEIIRRRDWYKEMVERNEGQQSWVDRCNKLITRAEAFIKEKGYPHQVV
jgi:uncharacterized protein (UPF0371 family)